MKALAMPLVPTDNATAFPLVPAQKTGVAILPVTSHDVQHFEQRGPRLGQVLDLLSPTACGVWLLATRLSFTGSAQLLCGVATHSRLE